MDVNHDRQLNIKLNSNEELRLIFDDISPRTPLSEVFQLKTELKSRLDLISEDRERLKILHKTLTSEKSALIQDFTHRSQIHQELSSYFTQLNAKNLKELEIEAKVLSELNQRKKALINKMRGLLQNSPIKENNPKPKRLLTFEYNPVPKLAPRESLSPCRTLHSERRQKVAAFRYSICN